MSATATIIHDPRSRGGVRLVVAVRLGPVIAHLPLKATAAEYEAARTEAQAMFPNHQIIIPRLGETP